MDTSNHELTNHKRAHYTVEQVNRQLFKQFDPVDDDLFETESSTPLGQLLKLIGSLPEIRHDKVHGVRRQIDHGDYDISTNLDAALDKVLEEFLADD